MLWQTAPVTPTVGVFDVLWMLLQTAFALVSPDTQGRNWKDKIDCYVSGKSLADAGVSINDVLASVLYMTGTSAKLTPVHDRSWRVTAPGYWAGPCN